MVEELAGKPALVALSELMNNADPPLTPRMKKLMSSQLLCGFPKREISNADDDPITSRDFVS